MVGLVITTLAIMTASLGAMLTGSPFWLLVFPIGPIVGGYIESRIFTVYGADAATPYMTRLVLGRLRLHIFWRGDADPDPHDHPWGFWTFPLVTYEEEVMHGPEDSLSLTNFLGLDPGVLVTRAVVQRFRPYYRPAEHTHRVVGAVREVTRPIDPVRRWEPTGKPIITIVWTEKESREWGFLKYRNGDWCWEPWRQYILEGGKHAMCGPNPPFGASKDAMKEPE